MVEAKPTAHSKARGQYHNGWASASICGHGEIAMNVTNMIEAKCAIQSSERRQKISRATPRGTNQTIISQMVLCHAPFRDASSCPALSVPDGVWNRVSQGS